MTGSPWSNECAPTQARPLSLQHALRLQEGRKVMPDAALLVHYAQVTRLWEQVMQPGPGD